MGAVLDAAREALAGLEAWEPAAIDAALEPLPEALDLKKRLVFQAVRVAVCGKPGVAAARRDDGARGPRGLHGAHRPRPRDGALAEPATMAAKPQTLATTSAFEVLGTRPWWARPPRTPPAPCAARAWRPRSPPGASGASASRCGTASPTTYRGHGTDRALVAGILGLDTDDERIRDAL